MRTLQDVQKQLALSLDNGLTAEAAADSRRRFGSNQLTPLPREPLWRKFLGKFDEPIIKILLAAALLSMVVDLFRLEDRPAAVPAAMAAAPAAVADEPPSGAAQFNLVGAVAVAFIALVLAGAYLLGFRAWIPSLLFLAAVLLWPVGLTTGHASYDGLAVMVAVILATGVAFLSEYKSDREFELLNARKELQAKVIRAGAFHTLPTDQLAVGDLVILEMGDEVPADGRLLKATELYLDQSLMTGESEPVRKSAQPDAAADGPEQPGCLYRGTQVIDGVGQMIVTEVGDETSLGQIARRLSAEDDTDDDTDDEPAAAAAAGTEEVRVKRKLTISKEATPLQEKLEVLAGLISKVGYIAAGAIFLALLVQGLWFSHPREIGLSQPGLLPSLGNMLRYFMYMVIIIVVAVPEGLPMSVTVSLALAMRKMTRANSLVRQLVACETIGSATVICSDKTGTLTQNKMQVVRLGWDGRVHDRGTADWVLPDAHLPWPRDGRPIDWIALNCAVNSTANLEEREPGLVAPVGNSTEGALLLYLREAGLEYQMLRLQFPPLYQVHFSSERKRMTTLVRCSRTARALPPDGGANPGPQSPDAAPSPGSGLLTLVKGAPEWVLQQSTHFLAADGTVRPWTPQDLDAVRTQLRHASAQAMRTLAFAHAWLPDDTPCEEAALHERRDLLEQGLVFAGFVAIRDPLRADVKDAIAECRRAGIEVKMVTGDNVETARAISCDIGLIDRHDAPADTPQAAILSSPEFNRQSDDDLKARMPALRVLARARPLDKFRMVKLLQEQGEVVAVTGDGTNDAPALKKADVGLAMGRSGTEVAKEASKIVLLDDAFSTIVKAVHWGRSLYENIQRFIQFQLTINVSALVIAFLGPFFGVKPPFTILQLLWINVIMDTFAAIALCSEPPRPGVMDLPPKRRDESIVTPSMVRTILTTAAFFIVVMMTLLLLMKGSPADPAAGTGEQRGLWAGAGPWSSEFPQFTVRQVSLFFTIYVFFQVWNGINCRSLAPEVSGLSGLFRNPVFLAILGTTVVVQVLIVTFGGAIFKVGPLGWQDWLLIAAGTASVLLFAEIARRVRLVLRSQ